MAAPMRKVILSCCSCCRRNATRIDTRAISNDVRPKKRRFLRFLGISLGVGSGAGIMLYYIARRNHYKQTQEGRITTPMIEMYRIMPLKAISRAWGKFNQLDLPVMLRRPLLGLYVWMFDCKLDEAMEPELKNYRNLGEFFRRILKPDVRLVSPKEELTNPADGKILHFGEVTNGILEQVKGVNYSIKHFLGPQTWMTDACESKLTSNQTDEEYFKGLNLKPGNKLYHCVVYLAPGDYHRFHSATKWTINYRRHFPGELLSVNPGVARWIHGLFVLNERVTYMGEWEHGFFSYTAVGATNVGSIKIYSDQEMMTNVKHHPDTRRTPGVYFDKDFRQNPVHIGKGEMFGEFNLGSTVVLVFEAPQNFAFNVNNDQKVRMGEPMGTCRAV
ncbi:phosphatidylserine decarboxylase proenzyme, mitochondrial-like isoform X1 [Ostrea edulis]|uniref:phosphatidylserine decarboxylase proenzyme, mitochondrial-like isoform X1 n=1 Tax=Ostrea edulis TaxID=37623 RepID=UPI0020960FEB|nr:phosphatidylserine decarboxylase proenzyme, mitochondrial-like isoform X1 [Ostrea edulis]